MKPPGLLDVLIKKKKKNTWRRAAEVSLAAAVMEHGKEPRSARLALETKGLRIPPLHNGFPTGQLRLLLPLQLHPSLHCEPETRSPTEGVEAEAAGGTS